jgi:hypothetical protein
MDSRTCYWHPTWATDLIQWGTGGGSWCSLHQADGDSGPVLPDLTVLLAAPRRQSSSLLEGQGAPLNGYRGVPSQYERTRRARTGSDH